MRKIAMFAALFLAVGSWAKDFTLTVLHTNDLHGRVESTLIKQKPFGGYARHITLINKFRKEDPNVLLLNAGDVFQGTLYFSQYEGLADLVYLNQAKYDCMTLGNHEFDRGTGVLANFLRRASFPIVCANLDFGDDPGLQKLVQPSTILTVGGEKVGVVGAITPDLFSITAALPSLSMKDLVGSVQSAVDSLTAAKVNKIILLSHCGYLEDVELAAKLTNVDVIIGGHSHTPLGTITLPGDRKSEGEYPTKAKSKSGEQVLVAQAWEWGKVFGRLQVRFNDKGQIISVPSATPIVVDENVPEDPMMKATVDALAMPIMALRKTKVTEATAILDRANVRSGESTMGALIADAMLAKTSAQGVQLALMNPGGIRADFEAGSVSVESCMNVQPFGNTLVVLDLNLGELKSVFENPRTYMLQVSEGVEVKYDFDKPEGERVTSIKIKGNTLWPIPPNVRIGNIRIVTNSFLAGGGDGQTVLKEAKGYRYDTGYVDVEALLEYLRIKPTWTPTGTDRIVTRGKLP